MTESAGQMTAELRETTHDLNGHSGGLEPGPSGCAQFGETDRGPKTARTSIRRKCDSDYEPTEQATGRGDTADGVRNN